MRALSAILLSIFLLAACGQKGPLVLPDEQSDEAQQREATAAEQNGNV